MDTNYPLGSLHQTGALIVIVFKCQMKTKGIQKGQTQNNNLFEARTKDHKELKKFSCSKLSSLSFVLV